jgi:hypothetical protein
MDKSNLETIYAIAHDVRLWAEYYAEDADFPKDLGGLCAIASGELHARLKRNGISSTIVLYEGFELGHCFVEAEGHVVDVTATQFHNVKEKVVLRPIEEARDWNWWTSTKRFESVRDLKNYQHGWGK